jgi:hypothetical protein
VSVRFQCLPGKGDHSYHGRHTEESIGNPILLLGYRVSIRPFARIQCSPKYFT